MRLCEVLGQISGEAALRPYDAYVYDGTACELVPPPAQQTLWEEVAVEREVQVWCPLFRQLYYADVAARPGFLEPTYALPKDAPGAGHEVKKGRRRKPRVNPYG